MWHPTRRQSWAIRLIALLGLFVSDRVFHLWPSKGATVAYLIVSGLLIVQGWSALANTRPSGDMGRKSGSG